MESKSSMKDKIKDFLWLTLGTLMVTIGVYFFKFPNNFSTGGVSGISVILGALIPGMSTGTLVLIINVTLLIVGFCVFGRSFGIRTVYCSMLMSLSIYILERVLPMEHPLTTQPMLELVFSVLFPAVGSAILFNIQGSTGGTDIVALLINKYHPINYGRVVLVTDSLIICASLLVGNGIETVIYGFLLTAVFGLSTDALLAGNQQSNQILVISHEHDRIAAEIVEKAHRGVTMLNGMGWYTKESSQVVMVICRKRETADILKIVRNLDPKAFVSVASVTGVYGQGFGIIDGGMLNGMKKN